MYGSYTSNNLFYIKTSIPQILYIVQNADLVNIYNIHFKDFSKWQIRQTKKTGLEHLPKSVSNIAYLMVI
jgi:hypothetical protein